MADESTRGGRLNNRAAQWEAGEGSCSVRAGAITARGSNGERQGEDGSDARKKVESGEEKH